MSQLTSRLAEVKDLPALRDLMHRAMKQFLPQFLSSQQVAASYEIMGVDSRLVADQTYFMVFCDGRLAGCGGWSRRETLFGGDHTAGRNPRKLNPKHEAARVRAMYTDPNFARKGVGRLILELCEQSALSEGFKACELAATTSGYPLYSACGYITVKAWNESTSDGTLVPLTLMEKKL
ncbi:MAG: GNAT family N-acetyltransferase [Robiginitomaculum sp.]|nr:GNAT family N-acetyltransferase [Robiginitomaculum sp.]